MFAVRGGLLSAALLIGCGGGGGFPDAPPIDNPPPPGTFSLAWALHDTSGAALPCDQIGAQAVTVLTHNRAVQGGSTEVFACGTGMGMSEGLMAGAYDLSFELDGPGGDPQTGVVATAPAQMGVEIKTGENVQLTPLTFTVDATGALVLSLKSNLAGGNCGTTANGGAGIDGFTIVLQHAGSGACEPVTFSYPANATLPAGTYTVNCGTPVVAPCIEQDQPLSVSGVAADGYQIHVRGRKMNADCWKNDDSMMVPPLGRTLTRDVNLAAFPMGTQGC